MNSDAIPREQRSTSDAIPSNRLLLFMRAARAPFLTVSVMPVLIGATLPFWLRPDGWTFSVARLIEMIVAVVLLHMGANLGNGYYDHVSGADPANPNPGVLSGGSGLITSGALTAGFFLKSSIVCLGLGAALGLHLNFIVPGNLVLVVGLIGVALAHFYTAPPVKLAYRGLGEIAVGLAFGVLPVVGAYYVQAGTFSWLVVRASLPIAFATILILWVNQMVDFKPDRDTGKRNLVVVMGPRAAGRGMVLALALLMFGSLFAAVFTAALIPLTLVAVLAFGLVRTVVADCWSHYGRPKMLAEAASSAIRLHLTLGIIIAGSALVAIGSR
ncbi:MAG: prenyltransferase [Candidatus Eisenbacteria sp.]|nr:prenyltransferase [Candidatus Eisenbacteria bacterium]